MKLNKLLATLFGALAFTACSKDELAMQTPEVLAEVPTRVAHLDLSVDVALPELRAHYGVEADPSANGAAYRLQMPEKDLEVRLVFAQNSATPGAPALMTTQTVVFKKTKGENRASFYGDVILPTGGTGGYRMAAMVLREVGGKEFARVVSESHATDKFKVNVLSTANFVLPTGDGANKVVEANVPYTSAWRNLPEFIADKNRFKDPAWLSFNARGTLLRVRIKNTFDSPKKVDKIRVRTNAFGYNAVADLRDATNNVVNFTVTNGDALHYATPFDLNLGEALTIPQKSTSDWQYIWVMPIENSAPRTALIPLDESYEYAQQDIRKNLPTGSIGVTIPIGLVPNSATASDLKNNPKEWQEDGEQPLLPPLAAFAEFNLAQNGKSFANSDEQSSASGYFTWNDVNAMDRHITISGKQYQLPVYGQYMIIFPANHAYTSFTRAFQTPKTVRETVVMHDRTVYSYRALYRSKGNGVIYGVRFIGRATDPGHFIDNRYRSAYRYKIVGSLLNPNDNVYLEVKARYMGEGTAVSDNFDKMEEDAYWTDPAGIYVTRKFPLTGYNPNGSTAAGGEHVGQSLLYWGIDAGVSQRPVGYLHGSADYPGMTGDLITNVGISLSTGLPVRLLKMQTDVTADN